jgi:cysteinyl-tRNA synthetase
VTIHDLLHTEKFGGRKWPGEVLRLAMLMTHYREPIDFSVKRLEEAAQLLYDLHTICYERPIKDVPESLIESLSNDLNFASALPLLHKLRNTAAHDKNTNSLETAGRIRACLEFLGLYYIGNSTDIFGFVVKDTIPEFEVEEEIKKRLQYLKDKNFAEADRIRDALLEQGIQLKDGKDPETGERVTTWEVKR